MKRQYYCFYVVPYTKLCVCVCVSVCILCLQLLTAIKIIIFCNKKSEFMLWEEMRERERERKECWVDWRQRLWQRIRLLKLLGLLDLLGGGFVCVSENHKTLRSKLTYIYDLIVYHRNMCLIWCMFQEGSGKFRKLLAITRNFLS